MLCGGGLYLRLLRLLKGPQWLHFFMFQCLLLAWLLPYSVEGHGQQARPWSTLPLEVQGQCWSTWGHLETPLLMWALCLSMANQWLLRIWRMLMKEGSKQHEWAIFSAVWVICLLTQRLSGKQMYLTCYAHSPWLPRGTVLCFISLGQSSSVPCKRAFY